MATCGKNDPYCLKKRFPILGDKVIEALTILANEIIESVETESTEPIYTNEIE